MNAADYGGSSSRSRSQYGNALQQQQQHVSLSPPYAVPPTTSSAQQQQSGDAAPPSSTSSNNGNGNGGGDRLQLDAFARMQLAAALLEMDFDLDGKSAEQSAIFAPFRAAEEELDRERIQRYSKDPQDDDEQFYAPVDNGAGGNDADIDALVDYNVDDGASMAWRTHQQQQQQQQYSSPSLHGLVDDTPHHHHHHHQRGSSFGSTLGALNGVGVGNDINTNGPGSKNDNDNDDELASQWGIDTVMSKFEHGVFGPTSPETRKPGGKKDRKRKKRTRRGTAHTDVSTLYFGDAAAATSQPQEEDDGEGRTADDRERTAFETMSAPDVLDSGERRSSSNTGRRRNRQRSATVTGASFRDELETVFGLNDDGNDGNEEPARQLDGDDRRGSFDLLETIGPDESLAAYAADPSARPTTSMGGYVSRFDPKSVAAAREEQISSKLRFPASLHPRILVMPAPLADIAAEEEGRRRAQAELETRLLEEASRPPVEREPGKLYGRSLMDELAERKMRQKAKNKAFQGDSRRAMMDNSVSTMGKRRVPSPLGTPTGDMDGGSGEADNSGKHRSLEPTGSPRAVSPSAGVAGSAVSKQRTAQLDADPWAKYASQRALATLASPTPPQIAGALPHFKLSPGLTPPAGPGAVPANGGTGALTQSFSTKELQMQYKHASMLSMGQLPPATAASGDDDNDSEDDDVPLQMRQANLAASHGALPTAARKAGDPERDEQITSVFGQDLVMQRELAKLEKILAIEEAERKIAQARQRVKDAERDAKEAKRRAKEEKKNRKKKAAEVPQVVADSHQGSRELTGGQHANAGEPDMEHYLSGRFEQQLHSSEQVQADANGFARAQEEEEEEDLWNEGQHDHGLIGDELHPESLVPGRQGRPRSSSVTPSLTLSFMPGALLMDNDAPIEDKSRRPPRSPRTRTRTRSNGESMLQWFDDRQSRGSSASVRSSSSDDEEAQNGFNGRPTLGRRGSSLMLDAFNRQSETGVDTDATDDPPVRTIDMDFSKRPELKRVTRGDSFANMLNDLGIREDEPEVNGEDDDRDLRRGKASTRRKGRQQAADDSDDDDDEEAAPLAKVLARRSAMPFQKPTARVAVTAPKLDLGLSLALTPSDAGPSSRSSPRRAASDSSSESAATNDEDDTPLAVQKLNAAVAAARTAKGVFKIDVPGIEAEAEESEESDEDDIPLAMRQADDAPLGQTHPMGQHALAVHQQAEQNFQMMAQMQAQYEMQYRMQMQMQWQQATMDQAALQGSGSQAGFMSPPSVVSMGGAASDVGLNLPPDPKLVSSVDRWRQHVS